MNVLLCGGGTAGHITPAIALYDKLKEEGYTPRFIVSEKDIAIIPSGYDFNTISLKAPGNIIKNIIFMLEMLFAIFQANGYIKKYNPEFVIGMGGFVALPMLFLAKIKKIKIFLCEQNSVPGKVNKMFYKDAEMVYLTFNKSLEYMPKGKVFGNPVRKEFFISNRESARKILELNNDSKVLLVMGGSQGSLKLNELILASLKKISNSVDDLHIYWLCGKVWYKNVANKINSKTFKNVHVFAYYKDMSSLIHAADFTVSRAGSSSVAEFLAVGLPSLLVPFPHATDNHQYFNARELVDKDMAYLVRESSLNADKLSQIIIDNMKDKARLMTMKNNMLEASYSKSDIYIVDDIKSRMS